MHRCLLLLALITLSLQAACSTRSADTAPTHMSVQPGGTEPRSDAWPAPDELLRQTAWVGAEVLRGMHFDTTAGLLNNVQSNGTVAELSPSGGGSLADAAYALYRFDLDGYSSTPQLHIHWHTAPAGGALWIGIADFTTQRWNWHQPAGGVLVDFGSYAGVKADDGTALVVVLVQGGATANLSGMRFGANWHPLGSVTFDPPAVAPNQPITLDARGSSTGPVGTVARYEWDLDLDGVFEVDGGDMPTLVRSFDLPYGAHLISLRVTDGLGNSEAPAVQLLIAPPQELFEDHSQPGDGPARQWLLNCYATLPEWRDADRMYQNAYYNTVADQIFTLVNAERAGEGLPACVRDTHLDLVAQAHSRHMGIWPFYDHVNPYGMPPHERIAAVEPPFVWLSAENIAYGFTTAAAVMTEWMNSPGHRANILRDTGAEPYYLGIGVYFGIPGKAIFWTQKFAVMDDPAGHNWLEPDEVP